MICVTLLAGMSEGKIRVLGGFNVSQYKAAISAEDVWQDKLSPEMGVGYDFEIVPHLSLQIEVLYKQIASRMEHWVGGFHIYDINYKLKEICVPLLVKATFGEQTQHYLEFGGAVSYILSHDLDVVGSPEIAILPPETKKLYPSLIIGLGLEFPIGGIAVSIEGRFQSSMSSILVPGENSTRHQGGAVLMGIGF